jgi:hypothetical protein
MDLTWTPSHATLSTHPVPQQKPAEVMNWRFWGSCMAVFLNQRLQRPSSTPVIMVAALMVLILMLEHLITAVTAVASWVSASRHNRVAPLDHYTTWNTSVSHMQLRCSLQVTVPQIRKGHHLGSWQASAAVQLPEAAMQHQVPNA